MSVIHIERRFNDGDPAIMWCGAMTFIDDDGTTFPDRSFNFVGFAPLGAMGATCADCKRRFAESRNLSRYTARTDFGARWER